MSPRPTLLARRWRWPATAVIGLGLVLSGQTQADTTRIRIGGTGSALGTMQILGRAFTIQNPDIQVTVLPSLGTSGAIKAVPKGAIDIGLASRPLSDGEAKAGIVAMEYARTPLVFAVSLRTQVTAITLSQVAEIYAGTLASWPDGSRIRPVLRQPGDDSTRQLRQMSDAIDQALSMADQRPGMPFATTDQETADKIESIPGAIGMTTLGMIQSEGRPLRALALDGIEASADNGATGRYAHVKRMFHVIRMAPSAEVKRFIAFVHSAAGRDILIRNGHWIP